MAVASKPQYLVLHVDFFVRSMSRSMQFYCEQLGFNLHDEAILDGKLVRALSDGRYNSLRLALVRNSPIGAMIELQEFQPSSALLPDADAHPLRKGWVSLLVPDLRAQIDLMRHHHTKPISDTFTVALAKSRLCEAILYADPDGNLIEFLQIQR